MPDPATPASGTTASTPSPAAEAMKNGPKKHLPSAPKHIHEVVFHTYPKLVFIWPIILAGLLFWLLIKR